MRPAFLPLLLLLLLHSSLSPALAAHFLTNVFQRGDQLWCDNKDFLPEAPLSADCRRAIEMIPRGLQVDPDATARSGRVTFKLDRRGYQLPARFHAGDCMVQVAYSLTNSSPDPAGHPRAGTHLYYRGCPEKILLTGAARKSRPRAKEAATRIVEECFVEHGGRVGSYEFDMAVDRWKCRLRVLVYKGLPYMHRGDASGYSRDPNTYYAEEEADWDRPKGRRGRRGRHP